MNSRGAALLAALVALVVTGMVSLATLVLAQARLASGSRQLASRMALEAAAGSAAAQVAAWDTARVASLLPGGSLLLAQALPPGARTSDSVTNLGGGTYLVTSGVTVGRWSGGHPSRQVIAQLVRILPTGEVVPVPGGWWRWAR